MKFFILSADARHTNPIVRDRLLNHFPNQVNSIAHADVVLVPVVETVGYTFNPNLNVIRNIRKPYVLLDYLEYGAHVTYGLPLHNPKNQYANNKQTHIWAKNSAEFDALNDRREEFNKLDEFVANHSPSLHFKRELFSGDAGERLKPLEFPCHLPPYPIQSREEYESRRIEVFYNWGFSHCLRPKLHGMIFDYCCTLGYEVCSELSHLDRHFSFTKGRTWVPWHVPHYARVDINEVLKWQGQSKISISMPGAGVKCFRSSEAPVNSLMALQDDDLAWSYPWKSYENCIRISTMTPAPIMLNTILTRDPHILYDMYRNGMDTLDKYRSVNYVNNYVIPEIKKLL